MTEEKTLECFDKIQLILDTHNSLFKDVLESIDSAQQTMITMQNEINSLIKAVVVKTIEDTKGIKNL